MTELVRFKTCGQPFDASSRDLSPLLATVMAQLELCQPWSRLEVACKILKDALPLFTKRLNETYFEVPLYLRKDSPHLSLPDD